MLIPDEIRKSVVFACHKPNLAGMPRPGGTAFFVGVHGGPDGSIVSTYFVTAKHVIDAIRTAGVDGKVHLRINVKNESPKFVESLVDAWRFHHNDSGHVDVAVLPFEMPPQWDGLVYPLRSSILEHDIIKEQSIGPGDEVFVTGLFTSHYGKGQNIPIVRIGHIAAMPEEAVETKWCGPMEAYLVEIHSIGGLSGSPVFVHLGPVIHDSNRQPSLAAHRGGPFYLLGLVHGHWNVPVPDADAAAVDDHVRDRINAGIAIVTPVSKVIETLNHPELMATRVRRLRNEIDKLAATPDSLA
jgi:hypothetical protein